MDKRVGVGLAAVVLIGAGFGAGWLVRGPGQPAAAGQPNKEDERDFWLYPKAVRAGTAIQKDSAIDIATFTTPDDIATVAAWYSNRLKSGVPDAGLEGIGPLIKVGGASSGGRVSTSTSDVNLGAGSFLRRGVKVGFGARYAPGSADTVFLFRADGEDRTDIIISFSRR